MNALKIPTYVKNHGICEINCGENKNTESTFGRKSAPNRPGVCLFVCFLQISFLTLHFLQRRRRHMYRRILYNVSYNEKHQLGHYMYTTHTISSLFIRRSLQNFCHAFCFICTYTLYIIC
jgi:hypothetical protein